MLLFAWFLPLFPIAGRISDSFSIEEVTGFLLVDTLIAGNLAAFGNASWHIVLPAFALALSGIGQTARLTRANMVETYDKPFIEMARSNGVPDRRIANRYAFKPSLIPSLTIIGLDFAAMLGNAFLVEAVFAWPGLSRYGVSPLHVMFREILPNCFPSIITKMTLDLGFIILIASSLSFLGLGVQPPTPDLGSMVADGAKYLPDSWWLTIFPSLAILVAVFGFNLIGDALREALGADQ